MKKTLLLAGVAMSLLAGFRSDAQVRVNVQLGVPVVQQPWYANDNDYYYMPDQGVYYNTRRRVYVYPDGDRWLTADRLPDRFGRATYRSAHYVRVHDRSPFDRDNDYRQRYHGGNWHDNGHRDGGRGYGGDHRGDDHRGNDHRGDDHHDH